MSVHPTLDSAYSANERKLFTELGFEYLFDNIFILPPDLYKMAAQKCFLENAAGPAVDALRRGLNALITGTYRLTSEFEELIKY